MSTCIFLKLGTIFLKSKIVERHLSRNLLRFSQSFPGFSTNQLFLASSCTPYTPASYTTAFDVALAISELPPKRWNCLTAIQAFDKSNILLQWQLLKPVTVVKTLHVFTPFSIIAFFVRRTFNAFRQPNIAALRWRHPMSYHQATSWGPVVWT